MFRTAVRALALTLLAAATIVAAPAQAASTLKRVVYRGYAVEVPRSWPVIDLAHHPGTCERFDRHAVYLGRPGADQRCPARPAGRTEAIALASTAALPPGPPDQVTEREHGVVVTATWRTSPQTIRAALHLRRLTTRRTTRVRPSLRRQARRGTAHAAPAGQVYTGQGFDACSTPSTATMSAWGASPYRAIGVYIGGANMACSQPNLTPDWVAQETASGWHLLPIYVGLQAPGNECGCAAISARQAAAQGTAAAQDATAQAQAIGLGAGNPVYFDMEGYTRGSSNTTPVLAFLQAWTQALHAAGYLSGVYSSSASGIGDLAAQQGTGYVEPDEIWIANWNGAANTADPNVPAAEWPAHQRIHQYRGGHDETWGHAKINIDSDYVDAATAAGAAPVATAPPPPPSATAPPTVTGAPLVGQTLTEHHGAWSPGPLGAYALQWEDCAPGTATCTPIAGATAPTYTVQASDAGQSLVVSETASNPGGTGTPVASAPTAAVQTAPTSGYWLLTAYGNVFESPGAGFYGSPAQHTRTPTVVGLAPTATRRGYWVAQSGGAVLSYGDAPRVPAIRPPAPVAGIAADPEGSQGFWLFTAAGNVIAMDHARFRGSPAQSRRHPTDFVGMAATPDGDGYWLVTATGRVYAFGDAERIFGVRSRDPIRTIVAAPGGGAWLLTARGGVIGLGGAPVLASATGARPSSATGMAATADGNGYWLVTASGRTYAHGDAPTFALPRPPHPVLGIVGG